MVFPKPMRILLILVVVMGLAPPQALARLQATTVLLPAEDVSQPPSADDKLRIAADGSSPIKPTSIVHLSFNVQTLPADARIESVTLRLEGQANNANPQLGRVFANDDGQGSSLGKWTATGDKTVFTVTSEALRQAVADNHQAGQALELWLRSTSRLSDWTYASTRSYDDKSAAKPRLVAAYSRDMTPAEPTDRTAWRFYGDKRSFRVEPVREQETLLANPVFYGDSVFLFAKPDSSSTNLLALSFNGRERWRSGVTQTPGSHAGVSPDGLFYSIGRERVARYDLNRQGALSGTTSVKDLKPSVPPTLGLDGSLYFSVYGQLRGLNPQLQEVWRYPQDKREAAFSPVLLSSGAQAQTHVLARMDNKNYLSSIETGSGPSIDTGSDPRYEQSFDGKYGDFHPPIVVPDEGGDYICLAANSQQGGLLACHAGGQLMWSKTGPVSRPLASADGDRLYVVQGGCLKALDRLNGEPQASFCRDGLAATSNLVLDGDGKVYFWNNGKLLSFDRDCKLLAEQKLPGLAESLQLLFSPDGTLFAVNPKTRQLASILPDRQSLTLSQDNLRGQTVYSADRLSIAQNTRLDATADIALKAGKSISIGRGFTVEKGGRVTLKTGY